MLIAPHALLHVGIIGSMCGNERVLKTYGFALGIDTHDVLKFISHGVPTQNNALKENLWKNPFFLTKMLPLHFNNFKD